MNYRNGGTSLAKKVGIWTVAILGLFSVWDVLHHGAQGVGAWWWSMVNHDNLARFEQVNDALDAGARRDTLLLHEIRKIESSMSPSERHRMDQQF